MPHANLAPLHSVLDHVFPAQDYSIESVNHTATAVFACVRSGSEYRWIQRPSEFDSSASAQVAARLSRYKTWVQEQGLPLIVPEIVERAFVYPVVPTPHLLAQTFASALREDGTGRDRMYRAYAQIGKILALHHTSSLACEAPLRQALVGPSDSRLIKPLRQFLEGDNGEETESEQTLRHHLNASPSVISSLETALDWDTRFTSSGDDAQMSLCLGRASSGRFLLPRPGQASEVVGLAGLDVCLGPWAFDVGVFLGEIFLYTVPARHLNIDLTPYRDAATHMLRGHLAVSASRGVQMQSRQSRDLICAFSAIRIAYQLLQQARTPALPSAPPGLLLSVVEQRMHEWIDECLRGVAETQPT